MSDKPLTFESAISRLEELTNLLESGTLSLDKSIEVYKEGINLAKFCEHKLKNVEQDIITVENSEYIPEEQKKEETENTKPKKSKKVTSEEQELF